MTVLHYFQIKIYTYNVSRAINSYFKKSIIVSGFIYLIKVAKNPIKY